ncbi:hypothetical protein GF358_04645 [Candidatus Woesearchaeota archaeon]|nr:hypothetical protein [Candidatus Woesearchaeota archaeon]
MYNASYEITHGVTCLGGKHDDVAIVEKEFPGSDEGQALKQALQYGKELSLEYLSDSKGKTTVTMTVCNPDKSEIDLKSLLRRICPEKSKAQLEKVIERDMPDDKRLRIVSTCTEHLLRV